MVRILGALVLVTLAQAVAASGLRIEQVWMREPAPGQGAAAIYLRLVNPGAPARVLDGARVEGASSAAVHTHEMRDGMLRMRPAGPLEVPAGGELLLEPGGHHLMVFGLPAAPGAGTSVPFCLHFADGAELCAAAVVRGIGE